MLLTSQGFKADGTMGKVSLLRGGLGGAECQSIAAPHHRLLRFTWPLISYALFSLPVPTTPTQRRAVDLV